MTNTIKTNNLSFSYNLDNTNKTNIVLDDINLSVNEGEFIAVLGHNGSGKSTLAKHFNAILLPVCGKCFVYGIDTTNHNMIFDIRQSVGMVFQNPDNQIVATIVEEDVAFAPENLGLEPNEIRKRVDYALNAVEMTEYINHAPHMLSGGQKQRVAIAGIIAMKPKCIVLDEPTAMLDPVGRREVLDTIKLLNKTEGITIILITHYMDEATEADRVLVMEKGKIIMDNTPKKVFTNIEKLKSIGLSVPQVTELSFELIKKGIDIKNDILQTDEFANELIKLLKNKA